MQALESRWQTVLASEIDDEDDAALNVAGMIRLSAVVVLVAMYCISQNAAGYESLRVDDLSKRADLMLVTSLCIVAATAYMMRRSSQTWSRTPSGSEAAASHDSTRLLAR